MPYNELSQLSCRWRALEEVIKSLSPGGAVPAGCTLLSTNQTKPTTFLHKDGLTHRVLVCTEPNHWNAEVKDLKWGYLSESQIPTAWPTSLAPTNSSFWVKYTRGLTCMNSSSWWISIHPRFAPRMCCESANLWSSHFILQLASRAMGNIAQVARCFVSWCVYVTSSVGSL